MGSHFHSSTLQLKIRTGVKEAKFLRNMSLHLSTLLPSHPVCINTDQPGWATGTPLLSFHYLCSQIQPCPSKAPEKKGFIRSGHRGFSYDKATVRILLLGPSLQQQPPARQEPSEV